MFFPNGSRERVVSSRRDRRDDRPLGSRRNLRNFRAIQAPAEFFPIIYTCTETRQRAGWCESLVLTTLSRRTKMAKKKAAKKKTAKKAGKKKAAKK
jgi:hypothetical protein